MWIVNTYIFIFTFATTSWFRRRLKQKKTSTLWNGSDIWWPLFFPKFLHRCRGFAAVTGTKVWKKEAEDSPVGFRSVHPSVSVFATNGSVLRQTVREIKNTDEGIRDCLQDDYVIGHANQTSVIPARRTLRGLSWGDVPATDVTSKRPSWLRYGDRL